MARALPTSVGAGCRAVNGAAWKVSWAVAMPSPLVLLAAALAGAAIGWLATRVLLLRERAAAEREAALLAQHARTLEEAVTRLSVEKGDAERRLEAVRAE